VLATRRCGDQSPGPAQELRQLRERQLSGSEVGHGLGAIQARLTSLGPARRPAGQGNGTLDDRALDRCLRPAASGQKRIAAVFLHFSES
jgi:hypothetical protein